MRLLWVFALICILAPAVARSQEAAPLVLDGARGTLPLTGHLDWLEDPQGGKSLDDARRSQAWQRLPGKLHVGFTPSAIWLRLTLRQPQSSATEWILFLEAAHIDEAVLHTPTDLMPGHVQRAGRLVPHVSWPMDTRTPAFRIKLPPGEHQLYLRLKSEHTLSNNIGLISADAFRVRERNEALFFGAFFGVSVAALALSMMFGGTTRQALDRSYLAYVVALTLATLLASGYLQACLLNDMPLPVGWVSLLVALVSLTLARMSAVWLELDRVMPRFSRWYQAGMLAVVLFESAWTLTQSIQEGIQLIQAVFALQILVSWILSIYLWGKGSSQAGFYMLIFGVVEAGVLIRFARNIGWLPINFFTEYATLIATALHLMAVSTYLITRFRSMKEALAIEQRARTEQREFVGMVSHEFKTPLAIISTSVQQLVANLDAPQNKVQERARNIRQAVHRMERLLNEYLSVERLDTAHQPIRLVATDFFEVVEEAVVDWPLERIRLQVDELPEPFVCDPDMMRIVLRNLLENADRHAPPHTRIDLTVRSAPDGSLRMSVTDLGEGVPPEELPKLFQKFFRGRASQGTPGAGLGLYLVARIVSAHHGQVTVDSIAGQGICFSVHLPKLHIGQGAR